MSRIGKLPVEIPEEVDVKVEGNTIEVDGPQGTLKKNFDPRCEVRQEEDQLIVERPSDDKSDKALQGMVRSIIDSMITGVKDGFEKKLLLKGVGYSAEVKNGNLVIEIGFSHPVEIEPEEGIEFSVDNASGDFTNEITVSGYDKQKVGEVAARIREIRKPEPYKGKGIRYKGEKIRRKVGKTG